MLWATAAVANTATAAIASSLFIFPPVSEIDQHLEPVARIAWDAWCYAAALERVVIEQQRGCDPLQIRQPVRDPEDVPLLFLRRALVGFEFVMAEQQLPAARPEARSGPSRPTTAIDLRFGNRRSILSLNHVETEIDHRMLEGELSEGTLPLGVGNVVVLIEKARQPETLPDPTERQRPNSAAD